MMSNISAISGNKPQGLEYFSPQEFLPQTGVCTETIKSEIAAVRTNGYTNCMGNDSYKTFGSSRLASHPFPPSLDTLSTALADLHITDSPPNYAYTLQYKLPSQGIPFHTDNELTRQKNVICVLTLGGERVLRLRCQRTGMRVKVLLEDESLYRLRGPAVTDVEHGYLVGWDSESSAENWHLRNRFLDEDTFSDRTIPAQEILVVSFRDGPGKGEAIPL